MQCIRMPATQSIHAMESCLPMIALIFDESHVKFIVMLSDRAAEPALVYTYKIKCF